MKLVMTLLLRDEEDILRANLDFHLAQGVDFIIATDNLSVDGTENILREYEAKGLLHYIHESEDNYNQHAWVTRMARMACTEFGADWIINNDADEFWWPNSGSLRSTFENLSDEQNILIARRQNFVVVDDDGRPFHQRMVYREAVSVNSLGQPLPPKVAHRRSEMVIVKQGNHAVSGLGEQVSAEGLIDILHYPIRTYEQLENKISKGGRAYQRNEELPWNIGRTWRALYEQLESESSLESYFRDQIYDRERLESALAEGTVVRDDRLARFFESTP